MTFNFLNYYTIMAFSKPAIAIKFSLTTVLCLSNKDISNKIQKLAETTGEWQLQNLKILNYPRTPIY